MSVQEICEFFVNNAGLLKIFKQKKKNGVTKGHLRKRETGDKTITKVLKGEKEKWKKWCDGKTTIVGYYLNMKLNMEKESILKYHK